MLGLVDVGHEMRRQDAYVRVFKSACLLLARAGPASGYCPGTRVCAAATGARKRCSSCVRGLLGAAAYMVTYPMWQGAGLLEGAATTLGAIPGAEYDSLLNLRGDVVGLVLGVLFIVIAAALPGKPTRGAPIPAPAE